MSSGRCLLVYALQKAGILLILCEAERLDPGLIRCIIVLQLVGDENLRKLMRNCSRVCVFLEKYLRNEISFSS